MNSPTYFVIQASDPEKLKQFYQNIFGWKFIEQPGMPIPYWRIETQGLAGGLLKRPAKVPPRETGTNAFTCSMQVESFDAAAKLIAEQGGIVALPKFAVPEKCWQGYFLDSDNNVFGIFEADEAAK